MKRKKLWSKSFGERGNRVRLYEARPGGPLMRSIFIDGKENRRSLGHRDKKLAEKQAYELLLQLVADEEAVEKGTLTLAQLQRLYIDSPAFADKKERTRAEDERRLDRMVHFLGPQREVETLTESDVRRFTAARRKGEGRLLGVRVGVKVRDRSVEADLVALHTMLNWGARERDRSGRRLISENPLHGVAIPKEKNPVRPVVVHEVFQQLLTVASQVGPQLRLALVVAEGTGRRLSAWRQLQWSDIDFDAGAIRWRAVTDKRGYEALMPMSDAVRDELQAARRLNPTIGTAWVFPSPKDSGEPCSRHLLDDWLRRAYKRIKVTPQPGGLWHPFRRKWASERKEYPVVDVAAAGGWKDVRTVQTSYQLADSATIRNVVLNPTNRLVSGM
jgi:integrase